MYTEKIKKIAWGKMVFTLFLTLIYEMVHLTPIKRLIQSKTVKVVKENKQIGIIPIVEYYKDSSFNKKLIIAQHGYGSEKGRMKDLAVKLADAGYFVITPDAYGHGERNEAGQLSLPEIIKQTTKEYDFLIEYYQNNMDVNTDKFSIVGLSMGGMIAYNYTVYGKYKPEVIAPTISSPDLRDLMNYQLGLSYYENHKIHHLKDEGEIRKYNRLLELSDSYEKIKNIEDVAIIVQNMRYDFLISSAGSDRLYNELKDKRDKKSFEYHKIIAFFHYIPDKGVRNIIRFLKQHNE